MTTEELFHSGNLPGLHKQAAADVAAHPKDASARALFIQVLCMEGQWDRASTQADALLKLNPASALFCTTLMQLIDGEREREKVLTGKAEPRWLGEAPSFAPILGEALRAYASGDMRAGAEAAGRVLDSLPEVPVTFADGKKCAWLLDGDARLSGVLEYMKGGQYLLVEQAQVQQLEVAPPTHPVEVIWAHVRLHLRNGDTLVGRMPGRYICTPGEQDSALLMARETDWTDGGDGLYLGRGQRCWNTDEGLRPMLREPRLSFGNTDP